MCGCMCRCVGDMCGVYMRGIYEWVCGGICVGDVGYICVGVISVVYMYICVCTCEHTCRLELHMCAHSLTLTNARAYMCCVGANVCNSSA